MERFERFMELVRSRGLDQRAYILAGLMPIKSAKMARYMQKRGWDDGVRRYLPAAGKAEDVKAEAVELVVEQIKQVQKIKGVAGVHLMAVAWEDIIPTVVQKAGLFPRPVV